MTIVTDRSAGSASQQFPTTLVYFVGSEKSGIEDLNIFQQLLISECPTQIYFWWANLGIKEIGALTGNYYGKVLQSVVNCIAKVF